LAGRAFSLGSARRAGHHEGESMRYGIDTGGTFTDAVAAGRGGVLVTKVPSMPDDPSAAFLTALGAAGSTLPPDASSSISHGTTVATNALLESKGGPSVLILTAGFKDLLEIGRQNRSRIYDLLPAKASFPLSRDAVLTAGERTSAAGEVLRALSKAEAQRLALRARKSGARSAAVCLLNSYADPTNENRLGEELRGRGLLVSLSHEVVGEFREFERCSTTFVNAYLAPVMESYLRSLIEELKGARFEIMQSSGGTASAARAARMPVRTLLSGPAAGVVGAAAAAAQSAHGRIMTLDMGGTSADVSLVDGAVTRVRSLEVGGFPVVTPSVMIETVGAGGGSLARLDAGGALRVGPESAGADPGPACYGKGTEPTVTDAHLVLGRISDEGFLDGRFSLYPERAHRAVGGLARRMGCRVEEAAEGVISVANTTMEKAIRAVSVRRGYDPRDFALVAFGGAGGLHACELAEDLGIPAVIVPWAPGVLSAYGLLCADAVEEKSQTVFLTPNDRVAIERALTSLAGEVEATLAREARSTSRLRTEKIVDLRYVGQSYEISVPYGPDLERRFHRAHKRLYGYAEKEARVEVVNVRARGLRGNPAPPPLAGGEVGKRAAATAGLLWWRGERRKATIYARASLGPGAVVAGPSIVVEYSATTFIPPGWGGEIDSSHSLILRPGPPGPRTAG
jgi:N-methylhydantoinase A